MTKKVILIAGPTASGKSALALRLALERDGVVINADSMQVYRDLRILTARPSTEDEALVPHLLYGHVPGREAYSAGRFAREAAAAIASARAEGRVPVVVGGTGLYFRALVEGIAPVPEIPSHIRQHWRSEAQRLPPRALHDVLRARDPVMAERLRPSDPQRITRALEVLDATGRSLAAWQAEPAKPVLGEEETERLVLEVDRKTLHLRCEARLADMFRSGAVEEVARLALQGFDPELPVMRALGVRPLLRHLEGRQSLSEALAAAQAETRQFVKRQTTWLKNNMIAWKRMSTK